MLLFSPQVFSLFLQYSFVYFCHAYPSVYLFFLINNDLYYFLKLTYSYFTVSYYFQVYKYDVVFINLSKSGWMRASTVPMQDTPTSVLPEEKLLRSMSETTFMSIAEPVLTWA